MYPEAVHTPVVQVVLVLEALRWNLYRHVHHQRRTALTRLFDRAAAAALTGASRQLVKGCWFDRAVL
jgi:hypothetical protein